MHTISAKAADADNGYMGYKLGWPAKHSLRTTSLQSLVLVRTTAKGIARRRIACSSAPPLSQDSPPEPALSDATLSALLSPPQP
jgi:hypothetical protein